MNKTEPMHSLFTKNYVACYPEKRKYPPWPEEVTTLVMVLPPTPPNLATTAANLSILCNPASSSGIGDGAGAVLPWMTHRDGPAPPPEAGAAKKKVRLFTVFVKIFQQSTTCSPCLVPFPI